MSFQFHRGIFFLGRHYEVSGKTSYQEPNHKQSIDPLEENQEYYEKLVSNLYSLQTYQLKILRRIRELQKRIFQLSKKVLHISFPYLLIASNLFQDTNLHEMIFLENQLFPFSMHQCNKTNTFLKQFWVVY